MCYMWNLLTLWEREIQALQLTAVVFSFSFYECVLCSGPTSCGITSGAAVCITQIFQECHRSSAKCFGSCCALRGAAIFPVTFCSATPSGVGACCSVLMPKSCVWLHVKHKKQTWMPKQLIKLVLLYTCWNAGEMFFFFCFVTDTVTLHLPVNAQECLADIGAETVWQLGNKNVTQKKRDTNAQTAHQSVLLCTCFSREDK